MCCGFKCSITDDIYIEKMISGLDRHSENTRKVIEFLSNHPKVAKRRRGSSSITLRSFHFLPMSPRLYFFEDKSEN